MAILYVLTRECPNEISPYPPTIMNSQLWDDYVKFSENNLLPLGIKNLSAENCLYFNDETELQDFLTKFRITDPTLLSDLEEWKKYHGISFKTVLYEITPITNIKFTPIHP